MSDQPQVSVLLDSALVDRLDEIRAEGVSYNDLIWEVVRMVRPDPLDDVGRIREEIETLLADPTLAGVETPGPLKRRAVEILKALRALPVEDQTTLSQLEQRLGREVFGITPQHLATRK